MKSSLFVSILGLAAWFGMADGVQAQTNYQFRTPDSEINGFTLPAPAGPDGNYFLDDNWFAATLELRFIPDFSVGDGERAFIENGGTAFVSSDGGISPGQIVLGSAGGTSGTLEVQDGGVLASRIGAATNGNITVGSAGGVGTLRVLPGGTLTAEGPISQGTNSANSILVGGLTGSAATLSASSAVLPRALQVFPNAAFSVTGGANFAATSNYTSEITGNEVNGKFDVGATATLAGTLNLNFNSYTPSTGHSWNVVEATTINGSFSAITHNAALAANQNFVVTKPDAGDGQLGYNVSLQEVLVLEVDRNTGAATIKHPGGASIPVDGYFVGSTVGSLAPAGRTSVNGQSNLGTGWIDTAGTATNVGELKAVGEGSVPGGNVASISLGSIFNATAGPFGQNNEDLQFVYRRLSDGAQFPGRVHYSGDRFNTLVLQVDPTGTGDAYLRNTSNKTAIIDGYEVLSEAGRLTTSGWDSLDEQNYEGADTWLELDNNANQVGEVNQFGFTTLGPGASLNLGPLYLGGAQDLVLNFLQMSDDEGIGTAGIVLYEAFEAILGDYNGNGIVDAADYTTWRDHLGQAFTLSGERPDAVSPGEVDQEDYAYWVSRFGATSNPGAASLGARAVPEPASWLLAVVAGVWLSCRRQKASASGLE
jgi:hypothetical protein